jgi:hypothetical protein
VVLGHPPAVVFHHIVHPADWIRHLDLVERLHELLQVAVPLAGGFEPGGRRIAGEPLPRRLVECIDRLGRRAP